MLIDVTTLMQIMEQEIVLSQLLLTSDTLSMLCFKC